MNLHLNIMVEHERRRDELAEIQKEQMLRASGLKNAPWTHRQLAALGNSLIAAGTWLQKRYSNFSMPTAPRLLANEQQTTCPE